MIKVLLTSFLIVAAVFFAANYSQSDSLLSPSAKKEKERSNQEKIDARVFEEAKAKVKTKSFDFAQGKGVLDKIVDSPAYIVVNKTGDVVFAKNPDKKRSPASLAKIMTAMIVLDFMSLSETVTVPAEATGLEPTILIAEEGEKFTVRELLKAMLITSTNDAAETLAYSVAKKLGGSREVFTKLMNEKTKNLGLVKTQFANSTGYDDQEQYSTARELAKMAEYARVTYPAIAEAVKTESASIAKTSEHKKYELPNWNSLLGIYPGTDGVKIGFTDEAGHVTIVSAERDKERFLVVLLGAPDRRAKDLWAAELLNSAFTEVGIKKYKVTQDMLLQKSNAWSEQLTAAQDEEAPAYNSELGN